MGAWDEGLYDNDDALDELSDLFDELDSDASPVALATIVGLRAWLNAPPKESMGDAVRKHAAWLPRWPRPARDLLDLLTRDAKAFSEPRARPEHLKEVIGDYCDGPKYEALLTVPGAEGIIAELARRAGEGLDERLDSASNGYDVATAGAHLGVLLELANAKLATPPAKRITKWRRAIERIDAATEDERDFFDGYFARFRSGLALLAKT